MRLRAVDGDRRGSYRSRGVFIAIGHKPNTDIFLGQLDMQGGYITTRSGTTATPRRPAFPASSPPATSPITSTARPSPPRASAAWRPWTRKSTSTPWPAAMAERRCAAAALQARRPVPPDPAGAPGTQRPARLRRRSGRRNTAVAPTDAASFPGTTTRSRRAVVEPGPPLRTVPRGTARLAIPAPLPCAADTFRLAADTDFAVSCGPAPHRAGISPAPGSTHACAPPTSALHGPGWAHSIEVYDDRDCLVGGLYGVALGGAFFGESMFSRVSDASKVALVALVQLVERTRRRLIDCQVENPHLNSLGARCMSRVDFERRLAQTVDETISSAPWPCRPSGALV
jgi:hypothetical protein